MIERAENLTKECKHLTSNKCLKEATSPLALFAFCQNVLKKKFTSPEVTREKVTGDADPSEERS